MTQQATQQNPKNPNQNANKKPRAKSLPKPVPLTQTRERADVNQPPAITTTITLVRQTLTPTKRLAAKPTQTIQKTEMTANLVLSTHLLRPVVKLNIPQRIATLEQTRLRDRLPGADGRMDRFRYNKEMLKTQM